MAETIKSLGICLGASTVSLVQLKLDQEQSDKRDKRGSGGYHQGPKPALIEYSLYPHEGDPKQTLINSLEQLDLSSFDRIAATGRKFRKFVNLTSISRAGSRGIRISIYQTSRYLLPGGNFRRWRNLYGLCAGSSRAHIQLSSPETNVPRAPASFFCSNCGA